MPHASSCPRGGHRLQLLEGSRELFPGAGGGDRRRASRGAAGNLHLRLHGAKRCEVAYALERAARRGVQRDGRGRRLRHAPLPPAWRGTAARRPACSGACMRRLGWLGMLWPGQLAAPAPQAVRGGRRGRLLRRHQHPRRLPRPEPRRPGIAAPRFLDARHRPAGGARCDATMARCGCACRRCAMRSARAWPGRWNSLRAARVERRRQRAAGAASQAADRARRTGAARQPAQSRAHRARLPPRHRPCAPGNHHRQRLLRARRQDAPGAGRRRPRAACRSGCCCRAATNTSCSTTRRGRCTARCCAAGVEIHEYAPSFLHAKVAVIDGHWATVGSSNLDPLSLLLAREANVVVDDSRFAAQLRERLVQAMQREGAGDERGRVYASRPLRQRFMERRCARSHAAGARDPGKNYLREMTDAVDERQEHDLVVQRPEGLYCPPGDFYIDPWRPVARAVITHAHSDHARIGHGHYLATQASEARAANAAGRDRPADPALRRAYRPPRRDALACIPPAMCWARRRSAWSTAARSGWPAATTRWRRTAPARHSSRCDATCSSPSPRSACRSTAGAPTMTSSPTSTAGGGAT